MYDDELHTHCTNKISSTPKSNLELKDWKTEKLEKLLFENFRQYNTINKSNINVKK